MKFLRGFLLLLLVVGCKSKYPSLENGLYADMQTNKGDVLIKLHYKEVPMTVANFVSLAEGTNHKMTDSLKGKPFYNGVKFHRVIKDFMIQSGDPTGKGSGGAGYRFRDEFPLNNEGELLYKHDKAGVLSMANAGKNTNSSQFFITHKETPWLDGKHSIFGQVKVGQNIVDEIVQGDFINKIEIIRVGSDAKKFKAHKVFKDETDNYKARLKEKKEAFLKKKGFDKSTKTNSGLRYLVLKEGSGKEVNPALPTTAHYTLYLTNGKKIDSSLDRGKEITFTLNEDMLIAGWKEGVKMMKEGEKTRFFIPSHLAYGVVGYQPVIEPKSDLIFEIEVIKVGE